MLLITGRLAAEDVRRAVREAEADVEVEVDVLPIDIAALIGPRMLARWMRSRGEFDLVLVSGLIRSDFSDVERAIGAPVRLGPKHAYDLRVVLPLLREVELSPTVPACVLLADVLKRRAEEEVRALEEEAGCAFELLGVKIGGDARMKVLAEVVDADRLSGRELERRIAYFIEQGADMIDLGISLDGSADAVRSAVETALTFDVPVSVDTLEPELIRAGVEAGCHMVLSLRHETVERLGGLEDDVAYVVLPEPEEREGVESLVRNMELARRAGAHMLIADPVLEPVGRGCAASICACVRTRSRLPDVPLFFGVGNVSELLDADSVGVNALLAALGGEVGASVLFTPEHSDKCRGSVRELARASRMMMLARHRNGPPKDLGLDLLVLKEKRRRPCTQAPEGCIRAEEREGWELDPEGAYTIHLTEDGRILVQHRDFCVLGSTAREVCDAILTSGRISSLSHAMYLGRELARAELALRLGRSYAQDDEW